MNSKSILLTIINLAFMLIVTAQENNTGTILIYFKPDNVKISISELDYKMKKLLRIVVLGLQ